MENHPKFAPVQYLGLRNLGVFLFFETVCRTGTNILDNFQSNETPCIKSVNTCPVPSFGHSVAHTAPPLVGQFATPDTIKRI